MAVVLVVTVGFAVATSPRHEGSTATSGEQPATGDAQGALGVDVDPAAGDLTRAAPPIDQPSRKEWEALLPRLEEAARARPEDVTVKRRLAIALYNLARYQEAAEIYLDLLDGKEDAVLRNRLGNVLRDQGDPQGAESAYRRAIATDPALPAPYVNLAELLWRQGKDAQAFALLEEGLRKVPDEARSHLQKALNALRGT